MRTPLLILATLIVLPAAGQAPTRGGWDGEKQAVVNLVGFPNTDYQYLTNVWNTEPALREWAVRQIGEKLVTECATDAPGRTEAAEIYSDAFKTWSEKDRVAMTKRWLARRIRCQ
jgi:hypothetical protein